MSNNIQAAYKVSPTKAFLKALFCLCHLLAVNIFFASSMFSQQQWFPIGPSAILGGQTYGGGRVEVAGRTTVIAVNPQNPKDVWLGTSTGGVWHSSNAGDIAMNWKPMSDNFSSMAIGAIALADCNAGQCNTIYVGTGENARRRDTYYGSGIFRIVENGGEFPGYVMSPVGNTESLFFGGAVNNLLLDGTKIYVTLSEGRTSSGSQSTVIAPAPPIGYGVLFSSDAGQNWTKLGNQPNGLPTDLKRQGNFLYGGFLGQGIYKYDLLAGGNWCPLNPGAAAPGGCPGAGATGLPNPTVPAESFNHVELEFAPSDPNVVYALFGKSSDLTIANASPMLYKSTNGGATWTKVTFTAGYSYGMLTYSYYTHVLTIHPTDPNTIFVGGLKLNKSSDGGVTFQDVSPGTIHPDHHDFVFPDPTNPDLMYNSNDGGFYYSFDGGGCWMSGNYDLQISSFYSVASDNLVEPGSTPTEFVSGGAQDNGTNVFIGGRVWRHSYDGDGGDCAIQNAQTYFASTQRYSALGTGTVKSLTGPFGTYSQIGGLAGNAAFYPPYIQHPVTKDIYTVTDRVYKAVPTAGTWTQVSPVFDNSAVVYPAIETPNVITAIAAAPSDANRLYVGLYNGAIWRSNGPPCNAFNCWTEVAGPNINGDGLPNAVISSIDVHPTNPNILYVTYSGFNVPGGSVWKSVSGGTGAWSPVSAGLPGNVPMNVIKINPDIPTTLWLGADRGVYRSTNQGASWEFFGPDRGMPNVPVYDIAIDNFRGRVYAATHGRGMFVLTTSPVVYTLEGWMNGEIWDILVYGEGFTAPVGTGCTVDILLEDGTVCASGNIDSYGNTQIKVGPGGSLVTDRQFVWRNRRVIAACLNGDCVGPTPISNCLADPNNKISSIKVTCGGQTGFAKVAPGCPQQTNPPSTVFQLDPPLSADPGDCVLPLSMETPNAGSFDVMIGMTATTPANGGDRILCGVRVDYKAGDSPIELAKRTRDAINGSAQCQQAKITAETPMIFPEVSDPSKGEDFLPSQPIVVVHSQGLSGGQLVVSLRVNPGNVHCPCFELQDLGLMLQNQLAIMKTTITTAAGGAQGGGRVVFSEYSQLGTCEMSVPTLAGETAVQIATKIETALLNMNEPGTRRCEARQNPYDVKREGADLITIAPFGLKVCTSDPKVGIVSGPDGLNLGTYQVDQPFRRYFALSVHSGITVPLPDFSDNYKRGLLGELDFEYRFSKKWSGEAILGRYFFGAKTGTALPDKNITAGIVNLKYYMKSTGWQPYFAGGLGVYFPDDQNTTAGLFLGAGVAKTISTHFLIDMAINGHILFNSAPNTSFVTAKAGVKYIF